ncbi:MAG: LarC family nickel insertion protein [Deltaproteobacteria bacterium]|nr:LarC family nickel insertion protein [Deltaproteobacteria bacterium]
MTRILYFDASAGVSGDMFVGALLDLGASLEVVERHVACLGVPGMELRARRVICHGVAATKFDVLAAGTEEPVDGIRGEGGCGHGDHHRGAGDHHHGAGDHHHDQGTGGHLHGHPLPHVHRGLAEIRALILGSSLPEAVAADAVGVFERLAEAEARVHGVDREAVHFHEVGALDAIADIVAAASAFDQVGPDEALCSPIHVGGGTVRCAHGLLPVPAPATLELLKGAPAYSDGTVGELATPTGVALIRHFCAGFCPMPPMVVESVGYGAGTKDFGRPNVLRATLGSTAATVAPWQTAQFS